MDLNTSLETKVIKIEKKAFNQRVIAIGDGTGLMVKVFQNICLPKEANSYQAEVYT